MQKSINFRNLKSANSTVGHIERRLAFAFSRTSHAIHSADVTVSDINGPKGGVDKQCRVVVKPNGMPPIVISENQSNLRVAIDRCISRASLTLERQLKRKKSVSQRKQSLKRMPADLDAQGYYSTPPMRA